MSEISITACPVQCAYCGSIKKFKLIADELLSDEECDRVLNTHLRNAGWSVKDVDICPCCVKKEAES